MLRALESFTMIRFFDQRFQMSENGRYFQAKMISDLINSRCHIEVILKRVNEPYNSLLFIGQKTHDK